MKQALISSAAAILIAGLGTVGVGWYLSPPRPQPVDAVVKGSRVSRAHGDCI
jgi:hypothetical protein